jgi:hypothetical protein
MVEEGNALAMDLSTIVEIWRVAILIILEGECHNFSAK